ncbi:hypothetical protein N9N67_00035 [Bacteriovoracaceae bacterium]|nr:hypothetical protein [Bacteriovoracaceae bacterium]
MKLNLIILSIFLTLIACVEEKETPEKTLSIYLKERTSSQVDLEFYQSYTAGKMLASVEALNEEEFNEYSRPIDVKKKKFKIMKKNCIEEDNSCFLTYIISYDTPTEKPETSAQVKKIAEMKKIENSWKIVEVVNVKTFYENKESIDITPESN